MILVILLRTVHNLKFKHKLMRIPEEISNVIMKLITALASILLFLSSNFHLPKAASKSLMASKTIKPEQPSFSSTCNLPFTLSAFSGIIILNEFSPLLRSKYLFNYFPFLSFNYGKGVFFLILSSFYLDSKLLFMSKIAGIVLFLFGGLGWIVYEYIR